MAGSENGPNHQTSLKRMQHASAKHEVDTTMKACDLYEIPSNQMNPTLPSAYLHDIFLQRSDFLGSI